MPSVTGKPQVGSNPGQRRRSRRIHKYKSAHNTSYAKAVQLKKGSGEKLAAPVVRIQTVEAKMHLHACNRNLKGLAERL
jgi:hypothetical protein